MPFQNFQFDSGLTAINEVCKRIDYILDNIFVFFNGFLYNIVYDVQLPYPRQIPYPGNFPYPGFLHEFLHNFIPGLPYPGNFPYTGNFLYPKKYPYHVIFSCPVKASIRKSDLSHAGTERAEHIQIIITSAQEADNLILDQVQGLVQS